jgi:pyruvate dehydrogenase E2 component (dihydrolipoamide acetyltransferase)
MAVTLRVPELGEDVDAVDVVKVLVGQGDSLVVDQPVIEVETEKASVEVPTDVAGVVTDVHVQVGDSLQTGDPIITVDEAQSVEPTPQPEPADAAAPADPFPVESDDEEIAAPAREEAAKPAPDAVIEPVTMRVPELGEGVDSVDVVSVFVTVGSSIDVDAPVMEVETEKASVEVPATVAGTITELHVKPGETLSTGDPIVTITPSAPTATAEPPASESPAPTPEPEPAPSAAPAPSPAEPKPERTAPPKVMTEGPRAVVPAAPTVRRFAREVGVDIATVPGSGPGGRISIDDVKAFAARLLQRAATSPVGSQPELPDFSQWGSVAVEPMSKIRKATAANLTRAAHTIPQVTNNDWADITDLERLRKGYRARVEAAGGKLTVTSILVKVVASALKVFPDLNASVDMENDAIVYKDYVHVGVAVDTEHGLLVPIIRDADRKNITEISVELDDLAARARSRKLKLDEMRGGSFSISNLGGIGGTGFSPIVNWPEVGILGVSRGLLEPRWVDGAFEPRLILPLSLSYDHRLVDGALAARFLRWVAEALEQPMLLALEG